jgi:hypothetical protein
MDAFLHFIINNEIIHRLWDSVFLFLRPLNTHFLIGRHENKEKRLFYVDLRNLLPIQIQLLEAENPKIELLHVWMDRFSI